ncbi:MAG: hypothetical protein ACI4EA_02260 [Candidatus Ornithomonoglobus sp.]
MFEKIKEKASFKMVLLVTFIFLIVYLPLSSFVSNWQGNFGVNSMDFRFGGYGTDVVFDVLNTIGASGRSTYVHLIILDCIMAILYMLVLVFLIGWLLKKYLNENKMCSWMLLCPITAMLSDWTENLMTYCLLRSFPKISSWIVAVESVCTTLKFSFIGLSAVIAVVIVVYGFCAKKCKK